MRFEFDAAKSRSNQEKHGIDFVQSRALWLSPTLELRSKNPNEDRRLVIGKIEGIFWTAIITYRSDAIRLISMRRSRDEEKEKYQKHYG